MVKAIQVLPNKLKSDTSKTEVSELFVIRVELFGAQDSERMTYSDALRSR